MFRCPDCKETLSTIVEESKVLWNCPKDHGRAITFETLRRVVDKAFAAELWSKIRNHEFQTTRQCPDCRKQMSRIKTATHGIELDVCEICTFVWLEYGEEGVLAPERRDAALQDVSHESPDEVWKHVPALFELPTEMNKSVLGLVPYVTWSVCVGVLLISLLGFFNARVFDIFAFVPADFQIMNLITTFFIHVNLLHLICNVYSLWLIGDNAEHFIGHTRFALLLALSTVFGTLLHAATHFSSLAPLMGASAGISGILVFYALALPRARLALVGRRVPFGVPVWAVLILWVFFNVAAIILGLQVAYFAHLGGALVGVAYWLWSLLPESRD